MFLLLRSISRSETRRRNSMPCYPMESPTCRILQNLPWKLPVALKEIRGKGSLLHYSLSFRWPIQMLARNSTSLRQNSFCEVLTLDNSPGRFFKQAKSASRKRLDYECWSVNGLETTEQAEMENVSDISSQREGGARSLDEETHLRWHYSVGVLLRTRILSWWHPHGSCLSTYMNLIKLFLCRSFSRQRREPKYQKLQQRSLQNCSLCKPSLGHQEAKILGLGRLTETVSTLLISSLQ